MFSILKPGDTILGMDLNAGGHLTHGAKVSFSGQWFNAIAYGAGPDNRIDFAQAGELARHHRPKLIVCGTTSYPRAIDFARFRAIADEVGALLLADITHIAGLVACGIHDSPVDHAHFTTMCTHKQLYGPRGGLILMGKDWELIPPGRTKPLHELVQKAVFPLLQGAPPLNAITAKARTFARMMTPEFNALIHRVVGTAREFASELMKRGARVITDGTDNHIVLVDVAARYNLTGLIAERALEECDIIVNKNKIPGETKNVRVTSGIRIGTNTIAARQFGPEEVRMSVELIDRVLSSIVVVNELEYRLDEQVRNFTSSAVKQLCSQFPLPEA
jgi:glycine hydroxymethyltransferase